MRVLRVFRICRLFRGRLLPCTALFRRYTLLRTAGFLCRCALLRAAGFFPRCALLRAAGFLLRCTLPCTAGLRCRCALSDDHDPDAHGDQCQYSRFAIFCPCFSGESLIEPCSHQKNDSRCRTGQRRDHKKRCHDPADLFPIQSESHSYSYSASPSAFCFVPIISVFFKVHALRRLHSSLQLLPQFPGHLKLAAFGSVQHPSCMFDHLPDLSLIRA